MPIYFASEEAPWVLEPNRPGYFFMLYDISKGCQRKKIAKSEDLALFFIHHLGNQPVRASR